MNTNPKLKPNKPRDLLFAIGMSIVGFILVSVGNNITNYLSQAQMGCGLQSMFGYNSSQCFWPKLFEAIPIGQLMLMAGGVFLILGIAAVIWIVRDLYANSTLTSNVDEEILENPEKPQGYIKRAHILKSKGEKDLALADFNKAIELDPNNFEAHYYRGSLYVGKAEWHNALTDYNNVIEHNPHKASAYNARGIVHEQMNELKRALTDFEKASGLDPASVQFKNNFLRVKAKIDIDAEKS